MSIEGHHGESSVCVPHHHQLQFRKMEFAKIPPDAYGVYGIWFRRRCIYIGKAKSQPIAKRLEQHWNGTHNSELADWISAKGSLLDVSYAIAHKMVIDNLERRHIKRFQPITNKTNL